MGLLSFFLGNGRPEGGAALASAELRTGFIGKIRTRPDFVRHGAGFEEIKQFDRWLQEGIAFLVRRFPGDWKERLGGFPAYSFYVAGEGSCAPLIGTMVASQDKTGRHHPFVSFALMKAGVQRVPELPLYCRDYFQQARCTGESDGAPWELDKVVRHTTTLSSTVKAVPAAQLAAQKQSLWAGCDTTHLWSGISGGQSEAGRAAFVRDLLQTLKMAANRGPQRTAWGIRFPLPESAEARLPVIMFWLSLTSEMLAQCKWRPHLFWSDAEGGAHLGLTVFFREPGASSFAQLLAPGSDEGVVVDVGRRPLENMPEVTDGRLLELAQRQNRKLTEAFPLWLAAGGKR